MGKMKKVFVSISILFLCLFTLYAESEGELLFKQNKPEEAVFILEKEIADGTASAAAWNYLGLSYYQLGDYEKSIEVFQKGLSVSGTNKKVLAFNAGNSCFSLKNYEKACDYFSLALKADSNYSNALLNRANSYLMAGRYKEACEDYEVYLIKEPNGGQNEKIIRILELLREEQKRIEEEERIAREEEARLAEEERLMQEEMARLEKERLEKEAAEREERERLEAEKRAEEERIAEEKRRQNEERRRRLLEEVANSLQNSDSTNLSSGAEDIMSYESEGELD